MHSSKARKLSKFQISQIVKLHIHLLHKRTERLAYASICSWLIWWRLNLKYSWIKKQCFWLFINKFKNLKLAVVSSHFEISWSVIWKSHVGTVMNIILCISTSGYLIPHTWINTKNKGPPNQNINWLYSIPIYICQY